MDNGLRNCLIASDMPLMYGRFMIACISLSCQEVQSPCAGMLVNEFLGVPIPMKSLNHMLLLYSVHFDDEDLPPYTVMS